MLLALFKQARQGRVTDKGKKKVGSKPAAAYAPALVPPATAIQLAADAVGLGSLAPSGSSGASSSHMATASETVVVYRAMSLVFVRGTGNRLFVAQLLDPLIHTTLSSGVVQVNLQYLRGTYFVPTSDIPSWPIAMAFWKNHGIANQAAADDRAAQSDGVHYSVYGRNAVSLAHSTIISAIDRPSEKSYLWMNLASFAIDEQELVSARELMSGGPAQPMEDDAEAEAAEREAETAATAAAAATREARYAELAARRESGKRKEVEKQAAKSSKKRRVQSDVSSPDPDSDDSD